ncbi:F-type H+-transporting ATPase subunit epsilon [Pseudobutyrivibrio sp. YE44]|uniref:ATP synthase F1 subunit epsilon n=1 Tax=Pseudobutyrivibrio sp. YE44 TaxID=1520802 RepID=UPI00088E690D|nr:ATP synthase F1 subunit epsilon [Pseudobutyrivibrio sp. YE44]SDB36962.1 F-type H+-transporting ATPase subunit epsilon [Pseudobutyrivibrio sp. YE44]
MADNTFKVSIITPERTFYEGEAEMVEFNTVEGQIGVYPKHIPLTTVIAPGICTIHEAEGQKRAAVHAGLAEVLPDKVTLLAEIAEWPDEIDLERARSAEDRARERLANKAGDIDLLRAEVALKKALVRQDLKA